jgi:endonuclease/exonuclease/phosphatase family metal-dependent hydrolase
MDTHRLRLAPTSSRFSARGYSDYVSRSWSHVLPAETSAAARHDRAAPARTTSSASTSDRQPALDSPTRPLLAQRSGFDYWSHQPNRSVGGVAASANGLLSKLEPREVTEHALPGRIGGTACCGATRRRRRPAGRGRAPVGAATDVATVVHRRVAARPPHAVLMGDFNCSIDRPEMQALFRQTRLQPPACEVHTFPSWRPQRAIDHILIGDGLKCSGTQALAAAFSDHLALSLELDVPDAALR